MKALITICLFSLSSSLYAESLGQERGGGNSINGRLVESYIRDADELPGYEEFVDPILAKLEHLNVGLRALIEFGFERATWYVVPVEFEDLDSEVTGIFFHSNQTAIQNLKTREIWISSPSFDSLRSKNEKSKLIVHEALLVRLGRLFSQTELRKYKRGIRQTVRLLFSRKFFQMTPAKFSSRLRQIGWNLTPGGDNIFCELGFDQDASGARIPVLCTEEPSYL